MTRDTQLNWYVDIFLKIKKKNKNKKITKWHMTITVHYRYLFKRC